MSNRNVYVYIRDGSRVSLWVLSDTLLSVFRTDLRQPSIEGTRTVWVDSETKGCTNTKKKGEIERSIISEGEIDEQS